MNDPTYGAEAVAAGLDAPFGVEFHEAVASTNDRARELAADGAEDVVVLADRQTGGRGRLDREWASPSGGVWMSILVRPALAPEHVPLLTLAAAVATTRAAREAGVDAGIKWPNDVLVSGANEGSSECSSDGVLVSEANEGSSERSSDGVLVRGSEAKLAGILTEAEGGGDRVAWVIVGIGVNANVDADALPDGATSIREQVGDVDRRAFVQRVLETFDDLRSDPDAILDAWAEHALTLGREVRVETPDGSVVGRAVRVEHPGTLVVETADGERRIHAGDCEHLRPVE